MQPEVEEEEERAEVVVKRQEKYKDRIKKNRKSKKKQMGKVPSSRTSTLAGFLTWRRYDTRDAHFFSSSISSPIG